MREVVSKNIALKKHTLFPPPKTHCFSQKPIVFQHVHFFFPIVLKRKIITAYKCQNACKCNYRQFK